MSGKKSREKGKRGERQARDFWKDSLGVQGVRRGQQYRGGNSSADIVGTGRFHVEVKTGRTTPNVYSAMHQCISDCPSNRFPLVQLKRDREQWLFILPEESFIHIMNRLTEYEE